MPASPAARSRRRVGATVGVALLSWLLFFGLAELGLSLAGVPLIAEREDPFRGFSGRIRVFERQGEIYRTRHPGPGATFNDESFRVARPVDGLRLFTLGGSSSYGFPWDGRVAFPALLGDVLQAAHPDRPVESVNASGISYAMHRLNLVADELLEYEPDLFVVYSGHNEFVEPAAFEALKNRSPVRTRVEGLLAQTRLYSGLYTLLGRVRAPPALPDFDERVRRVDAATFAPSAKAAVVDEFGWRLRRLVRRARDHGVRVVLCTVPANLRDWRPEASWVDPSLSPAQRRSLETDLDEARRRLEQGQPAQALDALDRALALQPHHALGYYLAAQAHRSLGDSAAAARAWTRAADEDASPSRRLSAMNDTLRAVARDHATGVLLVDVERRIAELSVAGVPGFDWIEDYVHPTPAGHREIAWSLWQALDASGWVGGGVPIDRARFDEIAARRPVADGRANPSWLYNQGILLATQGRDELAMERFARAVELDPAHGGALGNWVSLLLKHGRSAEALPLARRLVARYPGYPNFQLYLGLACVAEGLDDEARRHLERVLQLRRGDPMALYQLGRLRQAAGDVAGAADLFRRALQHAPDFAEARQALTRLPSAP